MIQYKLRKEVIALKILNFGSCNVDFVYSLDHIVAVGETQSSYKLELFPGGKGLNQSIAIARAGAEVFHAGCIGADGEILEDTLRENGVDLSYLLRTDQKNGHAIIQVSDDGDKSIFLYPGSNAMISEADADRVLSHFSMGDILLLQNEISNIPYIIKKAHEKGMRIIFNPAPFTEDLRAIDLNMLSYVILNEVEICQFAECEGAERALSVLSEKYPELKIVLTLGSRGGIYRDGEGELFYPAFRVTAVDSTAAGDTFTGYFAVGIARGECISQTLKTAAAAAAISVTRKGASPSIPTRDEVERALPTLSRKQSEEDMKRFAAIEAYVFAHLTDGSLAGLAEELGYSIPYTGKLVRAATGLSFSALLQKKRCERAASLLLGTDLPVEKIIEDLGYSNKGFFRRIFRERYGKTPLDFRKSK